MASHWDNIWDNIFVTLITDQDLTGSVEESCCHFNASLLRYSFPGFVDVYVANEFHITNEENSCADLPDGGAAIVGLPVWRPLLYP